MRETFVAVITSNIPMIFSVIKRFTGPIFTSIRSLTRSGGTPRGPQGGSYGMMAGNNINDVPLNNRSPLAQRRGVRSVHPLPTANESEESIYSRAGREAEAAADLPRVMGQAAQEDVKYEHTSGGSASESSSIAGGALPAGRIRKDTEVTVHISEGDMAKVRGDGQNNMGSFGNMPGDVEKLEPKDGPSVFRTKSQRSGIRRSNAPGGRI